MRRGVVDSVFLGGVTPTVPGYSPERHSYGAAISVGQLDSRLHSGCPLVGASDHGGGESPSAEWSDDEPTARVGGIRLDMAGRTERHEPVEIEVRAPLGALDDVVDLGDPSAAAVSTLCT
jgi:hypothetical protein